MTQDQRAIATALAAAIESHRQPWRCQHYRCTDELVAPWLLRVMNSTVLRLFCQRHMPGGRP